MLAFGLLDSAQTASLAKTVLDADTVNAIERFVRDDPIDEARSLVDDIIEVGIGGHFLARSSTRTLYRAGRALAARTCGSGRPSTATPGAAGRGRRRAGARDHRAARPAAPVDEAVLARVERVIASYRAAVV